MTHSLLHRIDMFLAEAAMPPSVFGRAAVRDPRLVFDLRAGRAPGLGVICRIENYMNRWRAEYRAGRIGPRGDARTRSVRAMTRAGRA